MKRILAYLKPQAPRMALQLTIKFAGTMLELLLPSMLSTILDDIAPTRDMRQVFLWGGLMIVCSALALVCNGAANRMATKISARFTKRLRHDLFEKVSHLSCAATDRFTMPSLISRLSSDTYNVHQMVDRIQRLGVRAPILLLGGIIVTLALEPVLTLVLIAILPVLAAIVLTVSRRGVPLYVKTQTALDSLVRRVQENMTGVRVIKALSKTEYEKERFDETNRDVVENERRAERLMAITNPSMNLLCNLGLTLVIIVGAYRVNAGIIGSGKIIAFLSYFTIILNALMMVTRLFVMYSKGAASAKRISEVLDTPAEMGAEISDGAECSECDEAEPPYHIEFRNVTFSYNKVRNDLENISFKLRRGETLGIIGATGSGKSTVIQLLLRFYDVDSGEILIDGKNIKEYRPDTLHSMFGAVFQNDFLYADTIRENIAFGRLVDDEALKTAIETAQAGFIGTKENGLDERLTVKGSNLSGGQRQRLLIARALAAKPGILLLDDCSSALDYKTDSELRRALRANFSETTAVIVAQRISSIMWADTIIVLDDGRQAGGGTHDELMKSCALYRDIYDIQMGDAA